MEIPTNSVRKDPVPLHPKMSTLQQPRPLAKAVGLIPQVLMVYLGAWEFGPGRETNRNKNTISFSTRGFQVEWDLFFARMRN